MTTLLDTTRAALGPAPRTLRAWDNLEPPRWMKAEDPLRATYARGLDLLKTGDVVWGFVVQANAQLFQAGDTSCPGHVIFGARPEDGVGPEPLMRAAQAVFALKGANPEDPGLARIAQAMTDEQARHPALDLPSAVTRGVPMRLAVVMIHRAHLPCGYLATSALPLVVSRDATEVAVLPVRHWEKALVTGWQYLGALGG